ncbi:4083_t:CDS:2, partial [Gigaspora rosea]
MKCLSPCVNVIPVIEDIDYYNIPIYNFLEEDDEETVEENSELWALLPFAIVKSEEEIVVNGRTVYGRQYPWGVVEVGNPQHSDFARLRSALLSDINTLEGIATRSVRLKKKQLKRGEKK